MLNEKMINAINDQIAREIFSEYLYLSMATHFAEKNLDGFSHWFYKQAEEEHAHALKLMHYIIERGGKVIVPGINAPKFEGIKPVDIFKNAWEHEQFITANINSLVDLAIELNDHASKNFLDWFVNEQVEEESSVEKVIAYLEMIGDNTGAIFMLNAELGKR